MRMRLKNNKKHSITVPIIILIVVITWFLFDKYSKNIEPKLISITEYDLDKYTNKTILNTLNKYIIDDNDLMSLLILTKNNDNEIISVDYNVEKVYEMLDEVTTNIQYNFFDEASSLQYVDENLTLNNNSFILSYPILLGSDNLFLNNLGPRIPIKINILNNILTNVNTNITDYGINTILIEMSIEIDIRHKIVALDTQNVNFKYKFLIASKVLNGKIPSYYGGVISKNSSIVS